MPATIAGSAKIVVWDVNRDYEMVLAMRNCVFYIGSAERSTTLSGTWRLAYSFDALSRPTSVSSTAEATSTYSHDSNSQVTAATHSGQPNETYGFDANGNRNTVGYTVATNNQTTAGLGFTFTFDSAGNRLTRTETSTVYSVLAVIF